MCTPTIAVKSTLYLRQAGGRASSCLIYCDQACLLVCSLFLSFDALKVISLIITPHSLITTRTWDSPPPPHCYTDAVFAMRVIRLAVQWSQGCNRKQASAIVHWNTGCRVQLTVNNSELDDSRQWRMRERRPIYSPVGSLKEHHSVGVLQAISRQGWLT